MTDYISSDLHFGHTNIIQYCNRPFNSVQHMNDTLIYNLFSRMEAGDRLILLGDILMGPKDTWDALLSRWRKDVEYILFRGNHDEDHKVAVLRKHLPNITIYDMDVAPVIEIAGRRVWCHHVPHQSAPDKRGYMRPEAHGEYDVSLCGHVHDKFIVNSKDCINVGVDVMGFTPLTLDEILEKAASAEKVPDDLYYPV